MGLRKDHWMLRLPQGPRHSAQGDHADQPQFTEKGYRGQREAAGALLGPQRLRVAGPCSVRQSPM